MQRHRKITGNLPRYISTGTSSKPRTPVGLFNRLRWENHSLESAGYMNMNTEFLAYLKIYFLILTTNENAII